MRAQADPPATGSGSLGILSFLIVLFATSALFYAAGPLIGSLSSVTQANVPAAALGVVCPAGAAVIVAARTHTLHDLWGALARRPRSVTYLVIAIGALPAVIAVSAVWSGDGAAFRTPDVSAVSLLIVYAAGSLMEEIGWTGFLLPRLMKVTGEISSALIIGTVWAVWHVIPYAQAGHPADWIIGQCIFSVVFRVLLVRLTVASGGSLWPAVIGHTTYNLAWSLSPDTGADYDPWISALLTAIVAGGLHVAARTTRHTPQA